MYVQLLQQLDRCIHRLRSRLAAFVTALLDPTGLVGVETRVVIVEFYTSRIRRRPRHKKMPTLGGWDIPIHSSHFMLLNPIVT